MKTVGEHWFNLDKLEWKSRYSRHHLELSTFARMRSWQKGKDEKQQSESCAGQKEVAQPRVELAAIKEECTAEELAASQMHAKTQLETEARPPMSEPGSVPAAVAAC